MEESGKYNKKDSYEVNKSRYSLLGSGEGYDTLELPSTFSFSFLFPSSLKAVQIMSKKFK